MFSKAKKQTNIPLETDNSSSDFFLSPHEPHLEENIFNGEGQLSCDIYQDRDHVIVKSTMAGVDPKNLDISVSNDLLTIRGYREMEEEVGDNDFYFREIYWGSFSRSIVLPQEVDHAKVQATLKNGVLTVKLPKKYKSASIKVKNLND
ncbi:MAG: Hsp20/alpha crystallin family protein [Patescibacteria group bacterium]